MRILKSISTILFITITLLGCNPKKTSGHIPIETEKRKTDSVLLKINSFLFLKKGMTYSNIKDYLNNNSIKYSKLNKVSTSAITDRFINEFELGDETYIHVYNYQIGNIRLDNFCLYFIGDKLYRFKYCKSYSAKKNKFNSKDLGSIEFFHEKENSIFTQFYFGLKEKYGAPQFLPNDILSTRIDVGGFLFDRKPVKTDANGIFILGDRFIKDVNEKFMCFWNTWFGEMNQMLNSSPYISISIRIDLDKHRYYNNDYFLESRLMVVEFTDDVISSFLQNNNLKSEKLRHSKEDSLKSLTDKFKKEL